MNKVQIAANLYECRDTAKRFFREEYRSKLEPYKLIIQAVMKANNVDEMSALLLISKTETYQEEPMRQILFMAAVVELVEPS